MADYDFKTATPETDIPDNAVIFGARSQSASTPSVFPKSILTTGQAIGAKALSMLNGEEGIALDFKSRGGAIIDYDGNLSTAGRLDDILTVSRSSVGMAIGRNRYFETYDANKLRYHYDLDTGEALGILREKTRTNLWYPSRPISTDFTALSSGSVTNASVTRMDGTVGNVAQISNGNANGSGAVLSNPAAVAGSTKYTFSALIRRGTNKNAVGSDIRVDLTGGTGFVATLTYTWGTGAVSVNANATNPKAINYRHEWVMVSAEFTTNSGNTGASFRIQPAGFVATTNINDVQVDFIQIEVGNSPSSRIVTTSGAATRATDIISIASTLFPYDVNNLTMLVAGRILNVDSTDENYPCMMSLQATTNDTNDIRFQSSSGPTELAFGVTSSSSSQAVLVLGTVASDNDKFVEVGTVKIDDVRGISNLETLQTDNSATPPTAINALYIGSQNGIRPFSGTIETAMVLTRAMTDAEITALKDTYS